jgi:hypothetical protein
MKLDNFFYESLVELSDIEIQKKRWLNINNNSGLISSFDELYCSLFDDMDFDFEITKIQNQNLENKLIILKNKLNNYSEPIEKNGFFSDSKIIEDPNWVKICDFAKEIIISLNSM